MKKTLFLFIFLSCRMIFLGQQAYETRIFSSRIKTLQIFPTGNELEMPILNINSIEKLTVSFDKMELSSKSFYYKIVHCNRNWQKSALSEMEYINGFASNIIDDVSISQNTITNYTNYRFEIPNENCHFKVSGNYVVLISEDNNFEKPDATASFYVYEPNIEISAKVIANTSIGFSSLYQQLEIEIDNSNYQIQNPVDELNLFIFQNRRKDNASLDIKPTFTTTYKQIYSNNKKLIFEGGNSYRFIDFADEYVYSGQIDHVEINPGYYNVITMPANRRNKLYLPSEDGNANGRYIINRKKYNFSNYEADYMWVSFILPNELEFYDYDIYILGDMLYNKLDDSSKMELSVDKNVLYKSLFLKQGGYSFLYIFAPKNSKYTTSLQNFEGSFWQTNNEYTMFLYHTPFGARYDRLIGYKIIKS